MWWYLNQPNWPEPNLVYLNQSLDQGEWTGETLTVENWRSIVHQKIETLDWPLVLEDVSPFIIEPDKQSSFNQEQLLEMLD